MSRHFFCHHFKDARADRKGKPDHNQMTAATFGSASKLLEMVGAEGFELSTYGTQNRANSL